MKRVLVLVAILAFTGACGGDNDDPANTATTSAVVTTTTTIKAVAAATTVKKPVVTTTTGVDPSDDLAPPDSQTPAAGTCNDAPGGIASFTLNPDIPAPRCLVVHDTDHLRVKNNMGVAVFVDDGSGGFSLEQGATYTAVLAVGGYWQPGVHRLKISNKATKVALYGGSGPEVWLK